MPEGEAWEQSGTQTVLQEAADRAGHIRCKDGGALLEGEADLRNCRKSV